MKTKIKRHSRSVISVLLAVCMLVSCMTAGMIMTDAAKVDSESVGATGGVDWGVGNTDNWAPIDSNNQMTITIDSDNSNVEWSFWINEHRYKLKPSDGDTSAPGNNSDEYFAKQTGNTNCSATLQKGTYVFTITHDDYDNGATLAYKLEKQPDKYYIHWGTDDNFSGYSHHVELTQDASDNTKYKATYSVTGDCYLVINNSSSSGATSLLNSSTIVNKLGEGLDSTWWCNSIMSQGTTYLVKFGTKDNRTGTVSVVYDTDGNTVDVNMDAGAVSSSMYIIGDRALGNGIGWTSGDARKEMTESGEDYTYTSVELPADSVYGFRLTNSSTDWGTNYGSTKLDPVDNDYIKAEAGASDNNIKVTFKLACSITVRYDTSEDKIYVTANPGVKSTLSIASDIAGAIVTATYNGTNKGEGQSFDEVPAGAQVTINVTPDIAGKVCTKIATTPADIASLSGSTWTLTMPAQDASIDSVTIGNALPKTVYFNNYVSQWSKVYVYTKNASGEEGNGSAPSMEMTQVGTSSIYSAEIPGDTTYIVFSGSGGATNEGSTHITYKTDTNYGNSLPSDYTEYKATAADGSTGEWTAHSNRDNVYTVTPGTSITGNNNLFYNGITATLYDYYTDGEYNDGDANWINGIQPYDANSRKAEYSVNNGSLFKWNPYKTFNAALSQYANDKNITYPLYFGNLNKANENDSEKNLNKIGGDGTAEYKNWYYKINNATNLKPNTSSVTGLAANEESNSSINYSNGTAMAMFDEDWLSQENSTGSPLATILHSSAFPVRKVNANIIYLDLSSASTTWGSGNYVLVANFHNGNTTSGNKRVIMNNQGNGLYSVSIPSGYTQVEWLLFESNDITGSAKNFKNAGTFGSNNKYKYTNVVSNDWNNVTGSWSNDTNIANSYTYYEFDSTDGTDNAYIQNVKTGDHTATMEYSDTTHVYSAGTPSGGTQGFFPFDNMTGDITNQHTSGGSDNPAHDLGFGMKLEIPFSLNPNGTVDSTENGIAQTFNFSGDDDLWVYIDGHLVLDLGGAHKKAEGSIDFKNKTATSTTKVVAASSATDNSISDLTATQTYSNSFASATWFDSSPEALHTMTIYYMERGMYDSNLKFNFSFHAIQNLYTTEKKIRTRNINSGFYIKDNTTRDDVTGMTKFEASYQYEHFNVDHKVSSDDTTYANPANEFNYARVEITPTPTGDTKVTHTESHAANADLVYDLTNDDRAQFNGKFTSGDYFQLTETPATSNKYSYTPTLTVYDDTDKSGKTKYNVTPLGDGSFKFRFDEPNTGLRTVNVRGQLENVMKQHDLTITKSIGDKTDTETEFEFQIKFKFAYHKSDGTVNSTYEGYPLYLSSNKDATKTQTYSKSQSHGYFKLKAGETITIPKIPEGAEFEIIETLDNITNYTYGGMTADGATAIPVSGENAVTMTMGASDVNVTATNNDNTVKATIRVKYAPSYYDFEHKTSNVTQDTYKRSGTQYTKYTNNIDCSTEFTDSAMNSTVIGENTMVETAVKDASATFDVKVGAINTANMLFIGWYDETGKRYNDTDETQHDITAKAPKDKDRIFEARFITAPTYRIDFEVPTRLWGTRIYKVFGKVTHPMISQKYIGYVSTGETTAELEKRYYLTTEYVDHCTPNETIFLKDVEWPDIDDQQDGKATTQYKVSKTVTKNTSPIRDVEETVNGINVYDLYRKVTAEMTDDKVTVQIFSDCANPNTVQVNETVPYGSPINNYATVATNIPAGETFYRWKIETLNSLGKAISNTKDGTLVTYDYSKNFNYVAYDNYKVTVETIPKKGDKDYNPYSAQNPDDPYHAQYAPTNTSSVIVLGQTRSHWNDTETGVAYVPEQGESANHLYANNDVDRLILDLGLSYSDGNETKLNTVDNLQVGFIIEYKDGEDWKEFKHVQFSSKKLGDKNRIEYYYDFKNATGNRNAKFKVTPTIGGVKSVEEGVEFDFSAPKFKGQTQ